MPSSKSSRARNAKRKSSSIRKVMAGRKGLPPQIADEDVEPLEHKGLRQLFETGKRKGAARLGAPDQDAS